MNKDNENLTGKTAGKPEGASPADAPKWKWPWWLGGSRDVDATKPSVTAVADQGNKETPGTGALKEKETASGTGAKNGAATGTDAKNGAATGTDGKDREEGKSDSTPKVFREPDGPLRPHRASPRGELLIESPRVLITPDAYKRMCLYIEIAPKEVGWLGTVSRMDDGDFLIEEVFLVEQEVTSVETELSVEGREKLVLDLLQTGTDEDIERTNKLRFWGHSHVRMGTGPSGTDENTMVTFGREGMPFYIRGIFTKLGRGEFTIYLYDKGYRIIDAPWAVYDPAEGIIVEPPRSYSWGTSYNSSGWTGYRPYERAESYNQGSIFGGGQTAVIKKDKPLPPQLVPDDALRAEVLAEYEAKVKERFPVVFKWFRKDDDDKQVTDGECIPTGSDVQPPARKIVHKPDGSCCPQKVIRKPAAENRGGGFFSWLGSLFSADPTPPPSTPPTVEEVRRRIEQGRKDDDGKPPVISKEKRPGQGDDTQ
ncbi:MAG TPA: hypothetical protein V6D17_16620 [Candidatus Obscuribacterales bacterium]